MTADSKIARAVAVLMLLALMPSCQAWQEHWHSPAGQAQLMQLGQQQHERNMANDQARTQLLQMRMDASRDYSMRMTPIKFKVEHSGNINMNHSGTVYQQHSGSLYLRR